MMPDSLMLNLTQAGIAGLWQGTILALMAAALLRLMPRASASLRHTLLVSIFAIAAVLPWLHVGAIHAQQSSDHALRIAPWLAAAIALAWLTLACTRATSLILAWRRLRTVRQHAVPIVLDGMDGFSAGTRRAALCVSPDVDSPTIIGFHQPRLLLPVWMAPLLTQDELRQIALHECEHLRRYDDWSNLLLQVGLVLSPLNPALVWLNRRIAMQRELACDAAVVASTAQPIAYATCLTRLAEQRMHHTRLALALAAWGKQSELGQRVHALLARPAQWTQRQSRIATCATAAALLTGTFGLAHTRQFVRIAAAPQTVATAPAPAVITATDTVIRDRVPANLRMIPASYVLKPVTVPAKPTRRKPTIQQKATQQRVAAAETRKPHMVRTSALATTEPAYNTTEFHTGPGAPNVHFITTEFASPYVAVPVANGWLIFQL